MTINDQKVREKLANLIHGATYFEGSACEAPDSKHGCYASADAILQSPELRVTLAEPRYSVMEAYSICPCEFDCRRPPTKEAIVRGHNGWTVGRFHELKRAEQYADWLNSKEPKS